jgi:hypothetical protein
MVLVRRKWVGPANNIFSGSSEVKSENFKFEFDLPKGVAKDDSVSGTFTKPDTRLAVNNLGGSNGMVDIVPRKYKDLVFKRLKKCRILIPTNGE